MVTHARVLAVARPAQPGQRRDVPGRAYGGALGQVGPLAGDADGVAQPAELVDQPDPGRVGAGPDPTARDLLDRVAGQAAALGDPAGEVGVDRVEDDVDAFALLGGEGAAGEYIRERAPCSTTPVVSPSLSSSSVTTNLPPKTPIDPVRVDGSATITSAGQAT